MAATSDDTDTDPFKDLKNLTFVSRSGARYRLKRRIGQGSYGIVFTCDYAETEESSAPPAFACKVIDKSRLKEKDAEHLQHEVSILSKIHHENVLSLRDLLEIGKYVLIVSDYMEGGELFKKIADGGKFSEAEARRVLLQIARGIAYLHEKGICHRDIKPENILCSGEKENFRVVIADFGLAKMYKEKMGSVCGSLPYAAPEILSKRGSYSEKCDIWSFGVVVYVLLTARFPFFDGDKTHIPHLVCNEDYNRNNLKDLSSEAQAFISRLLVKDADARPTAADLLCDRWMTATEYPDVDLSSCSVLLSYCGSYGSLQKEDLDLSETEDNSFEEMYEDPFLREMDNSSMF